MSNNGKNITSGKTSAMKTVVQQKITRPDAWIYILVGSAYTKPNGNVSPYGHTAIAVKLKDGTEKVYDYGRYRRIFPEEIMGYTLDGADSPRGEGILRLWNNIDKYLASEKALGKFGHHRKTYLYGYNVYNASAKHVISYYQRIVSSSKEIHSNEPDKYSQFLTKKDYFALDSNCTTFSLDGITHILPKFENNSSGYNRPEKIWSWKVRTAFKLSDYEIPKRLFMPDNLKDFLDNSPKNVGDSIEGRPMYRVNEYRIIQRKK